MIKRLDELVPPQNARIKQIKGMGALRQRMMDMGLVPGAEINVVRVAPMGDPIEYQVKGYHLSLRGHEAKNILVEVSQIALIKTRPGEHVRVHSLIDKKLSLDCLEEYGLKPGDDLEVLKNPPFGRLLVKTAERQMEIGRSVAAKLLVELPAEGEQA
jgi:ferrous iron transport protein A